MYWRNDPLQPMNKLDLDQARITRCRTMAETIAKDVQQHIDRHERLCQ